VICTCDCSEALGAVIIVGEKEEARAEAERDRPDGSRVDSSAAGYALVSIEELGPGQGHAISTDQEVGYRAEGSQAGYPHRDPVVPRPQRGGG